MYSGSDLGLNISRNLVQLRGGDIGVHSREGSGAIFGFFFRVRQTDHPANDRYSEWNHHQEESVRGQLWMDGLDVNEESKWVLADSFHETPLCERGRGPRPPRSLQECKQDKSEGDSKCAKETLGQECGDGVIMASVDKSFDPSTTSEETTNRREATERHVPQSGRQANDLQEPSERKPQGKLEALPLRSPVSDGRRHVLLVEDNTKNQRIIQRKLSSKEFRVSTTNNNREAFEFIAASFEKDRQRQDEAVDVVLMDQEMPIMDDNAATAQDREIEREMGREDRVPIVGVSANVRKEHLQAMIDYGVNEYITKPCSFEDMVKQVQKIMRENIDG
jgi:CheY-like chemotaxis protein